jgi:hypothetical protein
MFAKYPARWYLPVPVVGVHLGIGRVNSFIVLTTSFAKEILRLTPKIYATSRAILRALLIDVIQKVPPRTSFVQYSQNAVHTSMLRQVDITTHQVVIRVSFGW